MASAVSPVPTAVERLRRTLASHGPDDLDDTGVAFDHRDPLPECAADDEEPAVDDARLPSRAQTPAGQMARPATADTPGLSPIAGAGSAAPEAVPVRVVPQFIAELQQVRGPFQRLHLELFADALPDFLQHVGSSAEHTPAADWEALLLMLFTLLRRRGGLTPLQREANDAGSDAAFLAVCRVFLAPSPSLPRAVAALSRLLAVVGCTRERLRRPRWDFVGDHVPASDPPPQRSDDPEAAAADAADAALEAQEDRRFAALTASLTSVEASTFPEALHLFTLDSLPAARRGSITEQDFILTEAWFAGLPQPQGGRVLVTDGLRASGGVVGRRHVPPAVLLAWDRQYPGGVATLADLLRFLFRDAPVTALQRRVDGLVVGTPGPGGAAVVVPEPYTTTAAMVLPAAEAAARQLELLQREGTAGWTAGTLALLQRWFDAVDFADTGAVSRTAVVAAGGGDHTDAAVAPLIGRWSLEHAFEQADARKAARDGAAPLLSFDDVVAAVLPKPTPASEAQVQRARTEAAQLRRWARIDAEGNKRRAEQHDTQALTPPAPPPVPTGKKAPALPPPPVVPQLAVDHRVLLAKRVAALRCESAALFDVSRARADRQAERAAQRAEREEVARRRAAVDRAVAGKNVPLVHGPGLPPERGELHGFTFTRRLFSLSPLLERGPCRSQAVQLLQALDAAGVPAAFLLDDVRSAHVHVPQPVGLYTRVYRDIAVCPRRPSTGFYWRGEHEVHLKTNIPRHSDVKYRFHLEGYNPGVNAAVNTVVVGYAGRMLDKLDVLEEYGWPDGWDALTVVHLANGVRGVRQYFTRDGFVAFRLTASSFSSVGFGVSAWLTTPRFGDAFRPTCVVSHELAEL